MHRVGRAAGRAKEEQEGGGACRRFTPGVRALPSLRCVPILRAPLPLSTPAPAHRRRGRRRPGCGTAPPRRSAWWCSNTVGLAERTVLCSREEMGQPCRALCSGGPKRPPLAQPAGRGEGFLRLCFPACNPSTCASAGKARHVWCQRGPSSGTAVWELSSAEWPAQRRWTLAHSRTSGAPFPPLLPLLLQTSASTVCWAVPGTRRTAGTRSETLPPSPAPLLGTSRPLPAWTCRAACRWGDAAGWSTARGMSARAGS